MFNLFRRRYLISLSYLLVVMMGIIAWRNISLEMAPELNRPAITVSYEWGSTSPEVMEKEVTRRVEEVTNRLKGIKSVNSISRQGRSSVTVRFSKHTPIDYRVLELREYLNNLQNVLPANVRSPSISRRVPREIQDVQTFMAYSLSGERSVHKLLRYARRNIRLQLLGISGLEDVSINGARDPALTINFNTNMLEKYGVTPREVLARIRRQFQWWSSGSVKKNQQRFSILVPPQFDSIQQVRSMPLTLPHVENHIPLSALADVSVKDYPAQRMSRINGNPALSIYFKKEAGADAIALAKHIRAKIKKIKQAMPADMHLQLERDVTNDLRRQFGELQYQALISFVVVFLVLLVFIRRLRAPFVILGSILFSLLLSIGILYFIGYTLNIITLAGLTVALGMIIDNAVVVFEQINPDLPQERSARFSHIKNQLPQTLVPVLGSTLTTVGIFVPIFFTLKQLQIFLLPLAVALSLTLFSSVVVALSWIPYAFIWLVPDNKKKETSAMSLTKKKIFRYVRRPILWSFSWRHRLRWVFYGALIVVIGLPVFAIREPNWEGETSWPAFTKVYFEHRGDIDPWIGGLPYYFFNGTYFGSPREGSQHKKIQISIRTPQGTPIEEINKMAQNFEKIARPYHKAFSYYETSVSAYSGARLTFHINDTYLSKPAPYLFYAKAMYLAARTGNSGISVSGLGNGISTSLASSSMSQQISLRGFSYDQLLVLAKKLKRRLKKNPRVKKVDITGRGWYNRDDLGQYYLKLKDRKLALKALDRRNLFNAISLDINPVNTFGKVDIHGSRMYLIGRNANRQRHPKALMNKKRISRRDSTHFKLGELATLGKQDVQSAIYRQNQAYHRVVSVDFLGPYRLARSFIHKVVTQVPVPVGAKISYNPGGGFYGSNNYNKLWNTLYLLGLTIVSVWMIVSALLESWADPLVVILAVPLSLLGIMAGTLYHDLAFDRGAIAGTLLCVGVVVNNAILLMHEKQKYRRLGIHGLRSWIYVYKNKMRAVLITTLTTIGGLIPMIILGKNEFWSQLATVTVWGLASSTILLLLLMGIWEGPGLLKEFHQVNAKTRQKGS